MASELDLVLGLGIFALSAPLAWLARKAPGNRHRSGQVRWLLAMLAIASVLWVPWLLPRAWPAPRFVAALVALLLTIRIWESVAGKRFSDKALTDVKFFFWSHFAVPDLLEKAATACSARRNGLFRLFRALLRGVSCIGLLLLVTNLPAFYDNEHLWILRQCWLLWGAYLVSSAVADICSGFVQLASAHPAKEVFNLPVAAVSPRDFWSNRWNLMFRSASRRLIFRPLLRRGWRPAQAGLAVFFWSALAHEYLVLSALGGAQLGWMSLFFLAQGLAVIWFDRVRMPWGRTPRALAILSHWAWMIATSPLFFVPVLEIFPAFQWRAGAFLPSALF